MIAQAFIIPVLQRVDEALEDLDSVGWELAQLAHHPDLPPELVLEVEQKVSQAQAALAQTLTLAQEILTPFSEERTVLHVAPAVMGEQAAKPSCTSVSVG